MSAAGGTHPMEPVVILTPREQEYLIGAIEAAPRVRDLRQLFLWTQGQLQALLPHQLMLCMRIDGNGRLLRVEPVHAGPLDAATLRLLIDADHGLASRLAKHGRDSARLPAISGGGRRAGDARLGAYRGELQQLGFDHLMLHGSGCLDGGATLFALCGWHTAPTTRHAYVLSLLLPQLHLALLRVAGAGAQALAPAVAASMARPLSARELEILGWVREGKSNFEMGLILGLSPVTVKNHLQRIYRALGVSNRTHALARCLSLQLLDGVRGDR